MDKTKKMTKTETKIISSSIIKKEALCFIPPPSSTTREIENQTIVQASERKLQVQSERREMEKEKENEVNYNNNNKCNRSNSRKNSKKQNSLLYISSGLVNPEKEKEDFNELNYMRLIEKENSPIYNDFNFLFFNNESISSTILNYTSKN